MQDEAVGAARRGLAWPGRRGLTIAAPQLYALLFLVYAAMGVSLCAVVVPPFQNPDEINHFARADQLAAGVVLARRQAPGQTAAGLVDPGIGQAGALFEALKFHPERKITRAMLQQAGAILWSRRAEAAFPNTVIYAPPCYVPSVIGIWAGRLLGFSIVHTLLLSRLLTGAACILLGAAALARAGGMAPFLLTVLCLPMTLSLFAAVSQDGVLIATAALGAVLLVQGGGRRALAGLCACLAVVALARPPYLTLAALPLLRAGSPRRARLRGALAVALPSLAWAGAVAAFTMGAAPAGAAIQPGRQLAFLAGHPGALWSIAAATLRVQGGLGGLIPAQFVGVLGWLDVRLPAPYYAAAAVVLALALLASRPDAPGLGPRARALLGGALVLAVLGIYGLQYLTWTPVGAGHVDGVQGRYFLPLALFVPALRAGRAARGAAALRLAAMLFPVVSIAAVVHGLVVRYYF
jgi:hypothetical protein